MAITQSAKKAIRQNKRRRERNLVYITANKKILKEIKTFALHKKYQEAKDLLPKMYAALDKSAKVGIIKKNNASRHKSRITKMVEKLAAK